MAAIGYPIASRRPALAAVSSGPDLSRSRRHKAVMNLAGLSLLVGTWFGAGALVGLHSHPLGSLPGAMRQPGGYSYVVKSGDTLWSIASALEPGADPRPLVDQLSAELGSAHIEAGQRIFIALAH